ncbi:MAG: hypothetical protein H6Q68_3724 [Firmicutes bacterium]|nr:hypothetical protein [Bacillota bacterium]
MAKRKRKINTVCDQSDPWKMVEFRLLERAACSIEEKKECLPIVRKGLALSFLAREEGILSLDNYLPKPVGETEGIEVEKTGPPFEFSFFEHRSYLLAFESLDTPTLREIMLRYMISSGITGKKLFEALVALQTAVWVRSGDYTNYEKEMMASLLGMEFYDEIGAIFTEGANKIEQDRRRKWKACAVCTDDQRCRHSDKERAYCAEVLQFEKTIAATEGTVLADLFQTITIPFERESGVSQFQDAISAVSLALVFKVVWDCSTRRKLQRNMSKPVLDAVYESLVIWSMGD